MLGEWPAGERGQLLVATIDDLPVGVAYVALLTPTEAWLQGLRVHPKHRRKGLAHQFLRRCLDLARQRGAHVARLATRSMNVAVHKTTQRAAMRRVATVWVLEATASACPEGGLALTPLTPQDWPLLTARVLTSSTLANMGGLYGIWDFQHLERGQVWELRERDQLAATAVLADIDERWSCLSVAYVEAADSHAQALAYALRNHAADHGLDTVEVVVPSASPLHNAFLRAGFEPGQESKHAVCIYELAWAATAS